MNCERCLSPRGEPAEYRVSSELISMKVCRKCADEARVVGLRLTRLEQPSERRPVDRQSAA
jgi:hypothetical protein